MLHYPYCGLVTNLSSAYADADGHRQISMGISKHRLEATSLPFIHSQVSPTAFHRAVETYNYIGGLRSFQCYNKLP